MNLLAKVFFFFLIFSGKKYICIEVIFVHLGATPTIPSPPAVIASSGRGHLQAKKKLFVLEWWSLAQFGRIDHIFPSLSGGLKYPDGSEYGAIDKIFIAGDVHPTLEHLRGQLILFQFQFHNLSLSLCLKGPDHLFSIAVSSENMWKQTKCFNIKH